MNINDYDINYVDQEDYKTMKYNSPDIDLDNKYIPNSVVSIKGRQDIRGKIDRIEENNIIVKIMGETYRFTPTEFDNLFYIHPAKSPQNWYAKRNDWRWKNIV